MGPWMDVSKHLSVSFLLSVEKKPDCKALTFLFEYVVPAFWETFQQIPASVVIIKSNIRLQLAMCKKPKIDPLNTKD